jgi:ATP-dependent DNA helicase PIF1
MTLEQLKDPLNADQRRFVDSCLAGENVFLTGNAGTGKSFVVERLLKYYLRNGSHVGVTASTGVAALNIGGTTLHSWAGIGLGDADVNSLYIDLLKKKKARMRILMSSALFIDEISMIKASLLDKLDILFQKIRKSDKPFGGIQCIFVGDFLQLPAIIKGDDDKLAFESEFWASANFKVMQLKNIVRQSDQAFSSLLSNIRVGNTDDLSLLKTRIGAKFKDGINPVKLYSRNIDVDAENRRNLTLIKSALKSFTANEYGESHHLAFFEKNCPAPKVLELKVGAQVMLLKNLSLDDGLCNGAIGVVTGFSGIGVLVRFSSGVHYIERESWDIKEQTYSADGSMLVKVVASRSQIPLKLAWASTIHKVQGATIDHAVMDLSDCFECGQVYVALSRVRNLEGLSLMPFNADRIKVNRSCLDFYDRLSSEAVYSPTEPVESVIASSNSKPKSRRGRKKKSTQ